MPLQVNDGVRVWPPASVAPSLEPSSALDLDLDAAGLESLFDLGGPPGKKLAVPLVSQRPMELWCWVACAKMILNSFGIAISRTKIAETHLRQIGLDLDCYPPVKGSECDHDCQPRHIERIFRDWGMGVDDIPFDPRSLTFKEVQDEINAGRPVLVGIYWIEGGERQGGHVVVIRGWRVVAGEPMAYVNDPLGDKTAEVPYDDLLREYGDDNSGEWQLTWTGFRPQ